MKNQITVRFLVLLAVFFAITAFVLPLKHLKIENATEKFSKISIAVKSKVYVQQGDSYILDIKADDKTLEKITVEYISDELHIGCKTGYKLEEPVIINITTPVLNGITIAGSSDLFIEKTFQTNEMELSIAGSGNMSLNDLQAEKVSANIAGSGDIMLAGGKSESIENFSIAGSGDIDALGFQAGEVNIEIAGSGNCKVFAVRKLNISIAGSGDVYYKGNPEINKETAGSGKVKRIEQ
jgi:hypothetical protein